MTLEIGNIVWDKNKLFGLLMACWIVALTSTHGAAEEGEEVLPTYYPLQGLAIQYESKNCGYKTVVIETQLELSGADQIERVTAYTPRIMSDLYKAMTRYLLKNKRFNDSPVKQIYKTTINRVLGKDVVKDVLIMNVMHQGG